MKDILNDLTLRLRNFLASNLFKHALIASIIIGSALILCNVLYIFGQQKADRWMTRGLKYSTICYDVPITDSLLASSYRDQIFGVFPKDSSIIKPTTLALPVIKNCKVRRVYQQLTDVAFSAYNHLLIARQFMLQNFVCISMSSIFYIVSVALVAFVTKNGWSNTNPLVLTTMICATAVGTYFYGLTSIFKQELNAKKNIELYLNCINTEQEIRSSLVQSRYVLHYANWSCDTVGFDAKYTSKMDSLINYFDKEMKNINKLELGFDADGVKNFNIDLDKPKKPNP